jgi:hypothetical protein
MRTPPEERALELIEKFGTPEVALLCVDELIMSSGAKYWYTVKSIINKIIEKG